MGVEHEGEVHLLMPCGKERKGKEKNKLSKILNFRRVEKGKSVSLWEKQ